MCAVLHARQTHVDRGEHAVPFRRNDSRLINIYRASRSRQKSNHGVAWPLTNDEKKERNTRVSSMIIRGSRAEIKIQVTRRNEHDLKGIEIVTRSKGKLDIPDTLDPFYVRDIAYNCDALRHRMIICILLIFTRIHIFENIIRK